MEYQTSSVRATKMTSIGFSRTQSGGTTTLIGPSEEGLNKSTSGTTSFRLHIRTGLGRQLRSTDPANPSDSTFPRWIS
jgi:hypothetical protein